MEGDKLKTESVVLQTDRERKGKLVGYQPGSI